MAIDPALEAAVFEATTAAGQPRNVAMRLVAWLRARSEGGSSEEQERSFHQNVMAAIQLRDARDAD